MNTNILGATVYYFLDNKVLSAPVSAVVTVKNFHEDWAHALNEQAQVLAPFGPGGTKVATCHGIFPIEKVFSTKEQLLESL